MNLNFSDGLLDSILSDARIILVGLDRCPASLFAEDRRFCPKIDRWSYIAPKARNG